MSLHEEWVTYETIKTWVLDVYFDICRERGVVRGRPHVEMIGGLDCEFDNCFERPVEQLMLEVVQIVLSGGWYPEALADHRARVQKMIADFGLENLLAELPEEENETFRHDLEILKLVPSSVSTGESGPKEDD